ncbi:MAG: hypothetical protein R2795_00080 [Saprospiraceae bacterium]
MTSTYINTNNSDDWVLSFWLQRGGIADRPELQDSMTLQFFDSGGNWITVRTFAGMPANQPFSVRDTFKFYSEPITEDYQHSRFQFRFVNYADRSGFRDNWHLDYVRLDNNPTASNVFNDIAFMRQPDYMLRNYSSMPWRHFRAAIADELAPTIDVGVYNHFLSAQNASPSVFSLEELNTGVNALGVQPTLFNGVEVNLPNGVPINRTYNLMGDATGFANVWPNLTNNLGSGSFDSFDKLDFRTRYTLNNNSQGSQTFVGQNDMVERTTHFGDYFAYDDGTAESALETSAGRQVAVAYHANVADTLRGVRIHFPHTSDDYSNQDFRLRVWLGIG